MTDAAASLIHNNSSSSSLLLSSSDRSNDDSTIINDTSLKYIYKHEFTKIRYQIDQDRKYHQQQKEQQQQQQQQQQQRSISYDTTTLITTTTENNDDLDHSNHHHRSLLLMKESIDPKLGQTLTQLISIYNRIGPITRTESMFITSNVRIVNNNDKVLIDVIGNNDILLSNDYNIDLKTALLQDGYKDDIINCVVVQNICSMYIRIDQLTVVVRLNYIHFLRPSISKTSIGSVTSEGDIAMLSNVVRNKYNHINGTGLLIGVMSDAYNCLNGASQDIQTNDLPSNSNDIIIVSDLTSKECNDVGGIDEGRAMMQLIYDIVPGTKLAFRTAYRGEADFATGIRELANIGCDIIVDDIYYFNEPFYQDGIISQAIDNVVTDGVLYFTAMGNDGMNAWDASTGFVPSGIFDTNGGQYHQFDTTSNGDPILYQILSIPNVNRNIIFNFQWSEPYFSASGILGSKSDIDIYFVVNGVDVASSIDRNVGYDPIELFTFNPSTLGLSSSTINVQMYIQLFVGLPPQYMKLMCLSNVNIVYEYGIPGTSTGFGHSNSEFGVGVGAAPFFNTPSYGVTPPIIESFSTFGGTPIVYDKFGIPLPSSIIREQPLIVGPDGGITTFFGSSNRFFGTSASAPHVAAVAAMLLQGAGGRKSLTPATVYKLLKDTAIDMDDTSTSGFDVGYDYNTGYGLVNALAAFELMLTLQTKTPTKSPTKTPTKLPTKTPTRLPTKLPSRSPTKIPTRLPTFDPTKSPTKHPLLSPNTIPLPVTVPITAPQQGVIVPIPVPTSNNISVPSFVTNAPLIVPVTSPVQVPVTSPVQVPVPDINAPLSVPVTFPVANPPVTTPIQAQAPFTLPVINSPLSMPVPLPVPIPVPVVIAPVTGPVTLPIRIPIPIQVPTPINTIAQQPVVSMIPNPKPVVISTPMMTVPMKVPTMILIPVPLPSPVFTIDNESNNNNNNNKCGLFGLRIFCPFTFSGIVGRLLNLCLN